MPNNQQILAYVEAMKDEIICVLNDAKMRPGSAVFTNVTKYQLARLERLEKFIKGGN